MTDKLKGMVAVDFLDPSELCPDDPAEGKRVKVAVHALMLNPNDYQARFAVMQYAFGVNALYYIGKFPIFHEIRDQDRELFEFANQVVMAVCCHKLALSIHTYNRYQYSLRSYIWHIYGFAKNTVYGYVKTAPGAKGALGSDCPRLAREFEAYLNADSDARDALAYHINTQWAESVSSALSKHVGDFGVPAGVVRTRKVEDGSDSPPDEAKREKKYHFEQLKYVAFDMSFEECKDAIAALEMHNAPLYKEAAPKPRPAPPEIQFECYTRFYLQNSKNHTFSQIVNNAVNLEIGRLFTCEKKSLAEILESLGPDYPRKIAEKLAHDPSAARAYGIDPSEAEKFDPSAAKLLTPVTVRGRVYQNHIPMLKLFMTERASCISEQEPSQSDAKEESSSCGI